MKKLILLLIAATLLPAFAFAKGAGADPSEKFALSLAMYLVSANEQAARHDLKMQAVKQAVKAADSLKALMSAYPENASLIAEVARGHKRIVDLAAEEKDVNSVYQALTFQLEYLYEDFASLQKASPDVAAQVKAILQHEYWMASQNSSYTFERIKSFVYHRLCSNSTAATRNIPAWYAQL